MRAALYARYSTDLQSNKSIDDQIALCRDYLRRQGWTETGIYSDQAISGGAMVTRPAIQQLLSGAAEGLFDVVVAEALDRISRDQADTATIYKLLAFHDIGIATIAEGNVDTMHVGFKGVMNEMFLKDLAKKTRRGQAGVVSSGRSAGGHSYGYDVVRGDTAGIYEINEGQAEIVRTIFKRYTEGESPRSIAAELNSSGFEGPRSGEWRASTINGQKWAGNGILNNEFYIGRRVWNRRRKVTDPLTGKKRMRLNPREEWVIKDVPELRILDQDLWDAAKERQARVSGQRSKAKRPTRLLSGFVKCGVCGGPMAIVSQDRYGCSSRKEKGTCDNAQTVLAPKLERRVLDGLNSALLDPEAQRAAVKEFHAETVRQQQAENSERRNLEARVSELTLQIERIVDAICDGHSSNAMKNRMAALETEKEEVEARLNTVKAASVVTLHPNASDLYAQLVGTLVEVVADPSPDANEVRSILRRVIDRIVIRPRPDREYDVEIKGDLAAILDGNNKSTFMVGAGVGFEPTTFRL